MYMYVVVWRGVALGSIASMLVCVTFVVLLCNRNAKSSQEVVDFVGVRLRERVRERETEPLGGLLERVCEEVSV